MHNIKLVLAYDGRNYLGWQKNKSGPSIEGTLQLILEKALQEPITLQAASRTDAGVHAQGQVVNFLTSKEKNLQRLQSSLNQLLPKDIAILSIESVPSTFHPTLSCQGKEYHYHTCYGYTQLPQHRFYSWHVPHPLNIDIMRHAATFLVGTHDFATFCNLKKSTTYSDFIRTVESIIIEQLENNRLLIRVTGNHFLYKMVRNLVGTLVYIGKGKLSINDLTKIIESRDRTQAGVTAPSHGLSLHQVLY